METREFATYTDMQVAHQKDIDNFPITYIFGKKSDEELKEILSEIGATSLDECITIYGAGDVMRKTDVPKWKELCEQHTKEKILFAEKEDKLVEMILSEMYNHEYGYTLVPDDTLAALGKTRKVLNNEAFKRAWDKAEKKCMQAYHDYYHDEERMIDYED